MSLLAGCQHAPGTPAPRKGDEIVVAGQMFHTGTRVVTWMDPGGYDAYRVERRFAPIEESDWAATKAKLTGTETPNRYSQRRGDLTSAELERVRGGGWDLPTLQRVVDQFVIHYDVCGIAKQCFNILHDHRNLSVHFMLDLDGTCAFWGPAELSIRSSSLTRTASRSALSYRIGLPEISRERSGAC